MTSNLFISPPSLPLSKKVTRSNRAIEARAGERKMPSAMEGTTRARATTQGGRFAGPCRAVARGNRATLRPRAARFARVAPLVRPSWNPKTSEHGARASTKGKAQAEEQEGECLFESKRGEGSRGTEVGRSVPHRSTSTPTTARRLRGSRADGATSLSPSLVKYSRALPFFVLVAFGSHFLSPRRRLEARAMHHADRQGPEPPEPAEAAEDRERWCRPALVKDRRQAGRVLWHELLYGLRDPAAGGRRRRGHGPGGRPEAR